MYILSTHRYLDGTFKCVREPFKQLYTLHAFVKQGEIMKQVPLVFALMSRRTKQDYVAVCSFTNSFRLDMIDIVLSLSQSIWTTFVIVACKF